MGHTEKMHPIKSMYLKKNNVYNIIYLLQLIIFFDICVKVQRYKLYWGFSRKSEAKYNVNVSRQNFGLQRLWKRVHFHSGRAGVLLQERF